MDQRDILQLANHDLYCEFIEKVLTTPAAFKEIIPELQASERFINDFIFRIHVQTAKQFIDVVSFDYNAVLESADELIERATTLGLHDVSNLNRHILSITYKQLGYFEQAIEGFFHVINSEREHGIRHLTSIAYLYIGEIYFVHDGLEPALKYLNLALEVLEQTKAIEPRYEMKKIMISSLLFQVLYGAKRFDEMYQHIDTILDNYREDQSLSALYSSRLTLMFYYFARREFGLAKQVFHELLSLFPDDDAQSRLHQLKIFCAFSYEYKLDFSFYEEELLMAERLEDSKVSYINYALNKYLYEYYMSRGETENATEHLLKSFASIESEMDDLKRNKVSAFRLIEKNFSIQEHISTVQNKNHELKLMADEAIYNRKLAESTSNRLLVINELGKRLTHSLDVQGIIDTVYTTLSHKIPLDAFLIMIKDQQSNQLKSIAFYRDGERENEIALDADAENSAFVDAFRSNHRIVIHDFFFETKYHRRNINVRNSSRSVLLLPLSIENEVLGVCSVQHYEPYMYTQEHIEFMEELMPYLTIALNNAFKSAVLEDEIKQHRETQNELKQANQRLETLSYLDGLTQISNRRDFEHRVLDYLRRSREEGVVFSLFMFDIDFFKRYNDTYGHLAGDEALKAVATIVHQHFESVGGISARFGGEEFIAACLGLDEHASVALGNRIRQDVLKLGIVNENTDLGILSISVGVALATDADTSLKSTIMRWADFSLYQAKTTGKNKVVPKVVRPDEEAPDSIQ